MNEKKESIDVVPIFLMGGLFVLIDLLALVVTRPFEAAGVYAFVDPADPFNLAYFFLILLLFTAVILLISKFWKKQVVKAIILGSTGILCLYVFYPLLAVVVPETWSLGLSIAVTAILLILLVKYPEWYVVDISGVITGVGAIAILGISLSILIVIVLLIGMSIYDAISVYKTKHMIDLADTLIDLKLPVLFVIPKIREYSLVKEKKSLKEKLKEEEKRDAFFIGMGDIIIPGILVASAFHNLPSNGLLIALSVMVGTLIGFALLMISVIKGKPQAGLPYLCPGAIIGYLVSSYLVFGGIVGFSMLI
jgi:presenilin-like A22 family membrane protease